MRSEFKAKLLQHMLSKKDSEKGFTLIELLVVIIIIGILAAIALPSFLNQASKARQSEAKTYTGSMNRGQQAYYLEKQEFASTLGELAIGISAATTNYSYTATRNGGKLAVGTLQSAQNTGTPLSNAIKAYVGGVSISTPAGSSEATSLATLCEANLSLVNTGAAGTETFAAANWSTAAAPTCPGSPTTGGTNYSPIS